MLNKRTVIILFIAAVSVFFIFKKNPNKQDNVPVKYYQKSGLIFGTVYNISYSHSDSLDLLPQIQNALQSVDNSLSMFNPNSIISRVNNNDTSVVLDSLFLKVYKRSMEISQITNGAFDISIAPLVNLWGFGLKKRESVDSASVVNIIKYIGYDKLQLIDGKIVKKYPEIHLDASAIAKGFACDVVAEALNAEGCQSYCVEIGGEIVMKGNNPNGNPWRIGINRPIEDSLSVTSEIQEVIEINDGAMATSGNYRNFYILNGKKVSHTIDPHTGFPVKHSLLSATIIANDCTTADALATACMVMGLDKSIETIKSMKNISAYFIYDDDKQIKIWQSNNLPIRKKK